MSWVAVAVGAGSAIAGVAGSRAQSKAAKAAAEAGEKAQVDIPEIDRLAREYARRNAIESQALERELTPEIAALRTQANQALLGDVAGNDAEIAAIRASLLSDFNSPVSASSLVPASYVAPRAGDFATTRATPTRSALSRAASDRAAADLALGGALPQDVANLVSRRAAAQGGRTGSIALGRDISARDLGLTSLDLLNQRLAAAQQAGAADDQFALTLEDVALQRAGQDAQRYGQAASIQQQAFGANLNRAQFLNQAELDARNARLSQAAGISDLGNTGVQRRLALAGLANSIGQPVTGLDPSSVANLAVGNSNVQAAAGANAANLRAASGNSLMQVGGQLGGLALGYWANRPATAPRTTATPATSYSAPISYSNVGNTSWSLPSSYSLGYGG